MNDNKKAIVLLSGGLDSATCLGIAQSKNLEIYALSFDYGQKNRFELLAAKKLAQRAKVVEHRVINISLGSFGGSSLTTDQEIELDRTLEQIGSNVPSTYVPARNLLFLSYGVAWAEVLEVQNIYIGVNAVDFSGYPDCRPDFIESFSQTANLATKLGRTGKSITIQTPLVELNKSQIIKLGIDLGVDYLLTSTCYQPNDQGRPCARCDSCQLRLNGFKELGLSDPLAYQ